MLLSAASIPTNRPIQQLLLLVRRVAPIKDVWSRKHCSADVEEHFAGFSANENTSFWPMA
eukprot:scaffold2525_cov124-Pinguiococcus_pyrenoidosus.AAC.1